MGHPIAIVDTSIVQPGRLGELETAMTELAQFVAASGTRASLYSFHLTPDRTRMTVIQVHPDSESAVAQMESAAPIFARFRDLLTLDTVDVYGEPTPRLLELLMRKAGLLGLAGAPTIHPRYAGFSRG